jgi:hypothetical protein
MDSDGTSRSMAPVAPPHAVARLLQLTDEIGRLIASSARSPDLGWMIDEAGELMERINSLEAISSGTRSVPIIR